ncbi:MAG: hypothetical protein WBD93_04870 [Acidobacteriaceae bacterium]
MNHPVRETADNPAFAARETRDMTANPLYGHSPQNPYARIQYSGAQADVFQVLRVIRPRNRRMSLHSWGAFPTLEAAIAARDAVNLEMHVENENR